MNFGVSILLLCTIAGSCSTSGLASSLRVFEVCDHDFKVFRCGIERKCPPSLYPSPPIEVDGDLLDRLVDANHRNAYTSILVYASHCPFFTCNALKIRCVEFNVSSHTTPDFGAISGFTICLF